MPGICNWLVFFSLFVSWSSFAQLSTQRQKSVAANTTSIALDTFSIYPGSISCKCGDQLLAESSYTVDFAAATIQLKTPCPEELSVAYRIIPVRFSYTESRRDTSLIYNAMKGDREKFLIEPTTNNALDLLGTGGLQKSGSISRGISFGNRQDLSVNSSLNLELSGYVTPNLQVLASVTDDNLPIQPEGNTNKLQEFDQVFIQLFNDRFKLTAGDFWISKPEGYFLTYKKRGQGLTGEYYWIKDKNKSLKTQVSGALSKGKFNRQIIQGVEGNQGPYRLRGNENEPFIVVLSGTERVFIDGKLLTRGQEYDYVIDYNTSELTFTARQLITKDIRIVVEFQYSDQNYARSLFQFSTAATTKNYDWWINAYSEQDAKNQPLQQNLTSDQKFLLSSIGDNLQAARSLVLDSIGFSENLVLYKLIDSLGYDSVLVVSVDPNLAKFKVNFTFVGPGKGDYVFEKFNALGRVYKWVEPVGGISQGDYAPVSLLITPKQQQLFTAGGTYRFNDRLKVTSELGMSTYDLNTFSTLDRFDDRGFSMRSKVEHTLPFGRDSIPQWSWTNKAEVEALDPYFKPIEQYRSVEFDRDWNTRNQGFKGNQVYSTLSSALGHIKYGQVSLNAQQFKIGTDFTGYRLHSGANWRQKGLRVSWDASALSSKTANDNQFIRHKLDVSQELGKKIRIGYKDDQEWNRFNTGDSLLALNSYSFFDYQGYIVFGDTTAGELRLSYRERLDKKSDSTRLTNVAKARTISGEWTLKSLKNQRLVLVGNYRTLEILDTNLISQKPENTTNGRVDHEIKLWKSAISLTTFYEIGAGLEQKREFIYIKVNDGQGVYTWIDYNGDNVKDLNEFELAAYADQASYIRVFTPSSDYINTYSNEYNQSLIIRPERVWANKQGMKLFLSRFSTQSRFRIQRKTSSFDNLNAYNPFNGRIDDANLISTSSNMKHTLFFNRTSSLFGVDYSYQNVQSKTLLATGYDGKSNESHEVNGRWNISKEWSILSSFEQGLKTSSVDYTTGRNYRLNYWIIKPSLVFQPNTSLRFSIESRFSDKTNAAEFGGEYAKVNDIGFTAKYNQAQKGSLQAQFNFIQITSNGNANSPLGFELLEALKAGKNLVWSIGYQRTISKNLQLSIQYNGRQSEGSNTVHAGGMEVKAFF
jgi:hypothetical protein